MGRTLSKTKPPSPETIRYMSILIPALRREVMSASQMSELLKIDKLTLNQRYGLIRTLVLQIGKTEPLYEPIPGQYKILTDADIEEYREIYRRQKNA